jgi:hypothetical protein
MVLCSVHLNRPAGHCEAARAAAPVHNIIEDAPVDVFAAFTGFVLRDKDAALK